MNTQIGDVRYNATEQCFEALVTFHLTDGRVRVASRFHAPLSTELEGAHLGLWENAVDALSRPDALRARLCDSPKTVQMLKPRRLGALQKLGRSISRLAA